MGGHSNEDTGCYYLIAPFTAPPLSQSNEGILENEQELNLSSELYFVKEQVIFRDNTVYTIHIVNIQHHHTVTDFSRCGVVGLSNPSSSVVAAPFFDLFRARLILLWKCL